MSLRLVIVTLIALVLAGCASTSKVMLSAARTPIDPTLVRIYPTVPANAVQIAQLESITGSGFGNQRQTDAVIDQLKREAAKLGANGLVLVGVGSQRSGGGVSVGAGNFAGHVTSGLSFGIPTTRKQAAGIAIFVPSDTVLDRVPEKTPSRPRRR
ncbi:hypothetical protein AB672_05000 [Xylella taiwanensis]|nr:hypothetical protein AB672_05000 [Xylella taiwanensis]